MPRRDFYNDPAAPPANSVVPSVVAAVLNDNGELLMLHRTDNNLWALPGGGHDIGESIADTVVREVREETGITVEVISLTGVYTNPHHVMAYDDGEVRQQSSESREVLWVPPEQLDELDIHPSMRLRIDHALSGRSHPHIG